MKRNRFVLAAVAVMFLWASNSAMAYNFTITPGGSKDATGLSTINFDIFFNPDAGGNTFGTYAFALFYDTGELEWNSVSTLRTPPAPLVELFGPAYEDQSGHILNFNGASFAADPSLTSLTKLASVAFNIKNVASDAAPDVWFDMGQNSGFTVNGNPVSLTAQNSTLGADVAVAPEPVSTILFLSGGAVMGIRRFCKKA